MSFKDCVNTKDCEKMKTDIDDVKDSISGITDDVEIITDTTIPAIEDDIATINETTIPAIQDDISGLDDRVTTLENTPVVSDWKLFASKDWSTLSDENGKLTQDILMILCFSTNITSNDYTYNIELPIIICKGYKFDDTGFIV